MGCPSSAIAGGSSGSARDALSYPLIPHELASIVTLLCQLARRMVESHIFYNNYIKTQLQIALSSQRSAPAHFLRLIITPLAKHTVER